MGSVIKKPSRVGQLGTICTVTVQVSQPQRKQRSAVLSSALTEHFETCLPVCAARCRFCSGRRLHVQSVDRIGFFKNVHVVKWDFYIFPTTSLTFGVQRVVMDSQLPDFSLTLHFLHPQLKGLPHVYSLRSVIALARFCPVRTSVTLEICRGHMNQNCVSAPFTSSRCLGRRSLWRERL